MAFWAAAATTPSNGEAGDDLIGAGYGNDSVIADPGNDEIYLGGSDDVYGAIRTRGQPGQ